MKSFVRNGLLYIPGNSEPKLRDIVLHNGRIANIVEPKKSYSATERGKGVYQEIDAEGCLIAPGFIDLHVHFRDPGAPQKEDTKSGCRAAVSGGFTTVCTMPNTDPPIDTAEKVLAADCAGRDCHGPNVFPIAAITVAQNGRRLTDFAEMSALNTKCAELTGRGIAAVSEDGKSVMDSALLCEAMELAAKLGIPMFSHCEDPFFRDSSAVAEQIIAARDILLALSTGCRLHLCHVSTKGTVDLIQYGKAKGARLTAETAPHYFTLTKEAVRADSGLAKMNPPLRNEEDVKAIRQALSDGTIDAIATDHAPHESALTDCPYEHAANGVSGLETAFAIGYTELVKTGWLTLEALIQRMSAGPARILGIERGSITIGGIADLVIADLDERYSIDPAAFRSKGKNTPFGGMKVYGRIKKTLVEGKVVYDDRSFD